VRSRRAERRHVTQLEAHSMTSKKATIDKSLGASK
jgi:hypothetical protein